jgi:hypothetical protein
MRRVITPPSGAQRGADYESDFRPVTIQLFATAMRILVVAQDEIFLESLNR